MELRGLVSAYLPDAVVGSVAIALYNLYTGELTAASYFLTELPLHVLSLFVAFAIFDAIWDKLCMQRGE